MEIALPTVAAALPLVTGGSNPIAHANLEEPRWIGHVGVAPVLTKNVL